MLSVVAQPHTPEWHAARTTGIGASEIAAAAGICPYQTPLELYARKRGELPPVADNDAMRLGRLLEPVVKAEFLTATGLTLAEPNPPMYRNDKYPAIFATPDAIISPTELLECKTTTWRSKAAYGEVGTDDAPDNYVCQCQAQMAVMDAELVHLAVLFDGATLRIYRVMRNQKLIDGLHAAAADLMARVRSGTPPNPDWEHASTPDLIKELHPKCLDYRVELSEDAAAFWIQQEQIGQEIKRLEATRDKLKARVLDEIGDNYAGLLPDGRMVRRKWIEPTTYTVNKKGFWSTLAVKADGGRILPDAVHKLMGEE